MRLFVFSLFVIFAFADENSLWPLPYAKYSRRPAENRWCRVSMQQGFCPAAVNIRKLNFDPNDEIDIYILSNQVSDFDLTPMDHYKRIKVGFALHSRMTSKNYTITYSPFFSVLDATVPLIVPNRDMVWCNQAAVCVTDQLDAKAWSFRQRVGVIGGDKIDNLIVWLSYFNNTKPYFETFVLRENNKADDTSQVWMLQFDDTRFLLQTLKLLEGNGAVFYKNSTIHLSSLTVFCKTPELLGPPAEVKKSNPSGYDDARAFFEKLQPSNNIFTRSYHRLMFIYYINIEEKFYYLFNEKLWKLKLVSDKMAVEPFQVTV